MSQISIVHAVLSLYANITVNGDQKAITQIVSSSFRVAKAASQSISDGPSRSSRAAFDPCSKQILKLRGWNLRQISGSRSSHRFIQPIWHQFGVEVSTTLNFVSILACWSWLQISWQRIGQIEHRVYRKKVGPLLLVIYSVECTHWVWSYTIAYI